MRKFLKIFLGFLGVLFVALVGFLYWAGGRGIAPDQLKDSGILQLTAPLTPKPRPPLLLKIVSYNMGYASGKLNNVGHVLSKSTVEANLAHMAKTLKVLSPDVVLLQEVDFFSERSFKISQMEFFAKALELPYAAYALTWNKRYVAWPYWPLNRHFGRLVSGQAILSRYPLSQQEILPYPKPPGNAFWYNWFYIDRLIQRVRVETGKQSIEIYNVHLEAFSPETRKWQLEQLSKWIQDSPTANKIVGGDFNLIWQRKNNTGTAFQEGNNQLAGFSAATGLTMGNAAQNHFTFPSWDPEKRIDFIFFSPHFEAMTGGVIENLPASDHLPVWLVLRNTQN